MVAFIRFLVLNIFLFSYVYGNVEPSSEDVKWLKAGRSVLVYLPTPDLPFWNQRDQIATSSPGAFIFNFTLTSDNHTLLLNDEPIFPRAHRHHPTPLRVYQTPESVSYFAGRVCCLNFTTAPVMYLDYYIQTPDPTSGTSIYNTEYNPRLTIDILRASMPTYPGYNIPLSSKSQKQIWVYLKDLSVHPPNTLYSKIPLRIDGVKADRRWLRFRSQETDTYQNPKNLKKCYIWSWLCADIREYPYYSYIYRENFDQYGKKGSMRHFLTSKWGLLVGLIGFWQAVVLFAFGGGTVLLRAVHVVLKGVKYVVKIHEDRIQEVDEWLADEEIEVLIDDDGYSDNFGDVKKKVEKVGVVEGKGGEKTSVQESLSSPPAYIPMKTEKSSNL